MKKIISLLGLLSIGLYSISQNVGIGTNSPQAKLDIKGNFRAGGLNNFLLYDSGKFTWSNSYLFLPSSQYIIQHSASAEGLYYGNSQLEYRYQDGTPRFYTNWSNGNGYFYGNLGIGVITPQFPLSLSAVTGDKISLYGDAGDHYGFGVQPSLLQIHTDGPTADIAFGYGSSSSFTERMRIKGNGTLRLEGPLTPGGIIPALSMSSTGEVQVDAPFIPGGRFLIKENGKTGIGLVNPQQRLSVKLGMNIDQADLNNGTLDSSVLRFGSNSGEAIGSGRTGLNNQYGLDFYTASAKRMVITNGGNVGIGISNPGFKLDIADRMRIRSGGGFSSAGLYLNNNNNTASPAFIGMHDDNHVGFWGSTAGWGFTMNTDNGALKVNGSEGAAGQVLVSNGPNLPSQWVNNKPYSLLVDSNAPMTLLGSGSINSVTIPGINNYSFTLAQTSTIVSTITADMFANNCTVGCGDSWAYLYIEFIQSPNTYINSQNLYCTVKNQTLETKTGSKQIVLGPGTYTINAQFNHSGAGNGEMTVSNGRASLILQIFP